MTTAFNPHEYLNSFTNFESQLHRLGPDDFNLNRIQEFLDLAGNPNKNLKIIHVAGTKGKGSTCALMASVLQEAGYKVGLYTSPHLHRLNERIRVLSKDNRRSKEAFYGSISDDDLANIIASLRPIAASIINKGNVLTFFEFVTVAAISYFAKSQVDIVILETGLGGRLDATNTVDSMIAVITPVSMDHMRILGNTLGKIAFEKAHIIKDTHQRVVIAPQEKSAMDVILHRCREFGIQPFIVHPENYKDLKVGLKGKHQIINAAVAIEALNALRAKGFKISEEAISDGITHVQWPGRFERLRKNPDLIVDCAHNEASAQVLAQTLKEEYPQRRVILVLGISQDKDVAAFCRQLNNQVAQVILTKANHPRSHQFTETEVRNYFSDKPCEIVDNVKQAVEKALRIAKLQDVILVTGSVFVVAEASESLCAKDE